MLKVCPRTIRAMVSQPTAPMDRNSRVLAAAEDDGQKYDEKDQRQAAQDLDDAHHQMVGAAADVAGDRAIADAHTQADGARDAGRRPAKRVRRRACARKDRAPAGRCRTNARSARPGTRATCDQSSASMSLGLNHGPTSARRPRCAMMHISATMAPGFARKRRPASLPEAPLIGRT